MTKVLRANEVPYMTKVLRANDVPYMTKLLRKAIMTWSRLENSYYKTHSVEDKNKL